MIHNDVIALGFTPMQIKIYLPPPTLKKIKSGSKREGNQQAYTELHYDSDVVLKIFNHLKKYTSVKLG